MKLRSLVAAVFFFAASPRSIVLANCEGHGGPAGCDRASGVVLGGDGTLDMRVRCTQSKHRQRNPKARVLKLNPPSTNHGQILSPGEKPPATSIENSK